MAAENIGVALVPVFWLFRLGFAEPLPEVRLPIPLHDRLDVSVLQNRPVPNKLLRDPGSWSCNRNKDTKRNQPLECLSIHNR